MKLTTTSSRPAPIEPLETRIAPAFVSGTVNLAGLAGSNGSAFHGVSNGDYAGRSVGAAGDVNGDGFGDFIVGTNPNAYAGEAYVIFGTAAGLPQDATLNGVFIDGTKGFALIGESAGAHVVSAAGDVNGDGFDDVIVGAPSAPGNVNRAGAAYVMFGQAGGFAAQVVLGGLDGRTGFKISGQYADVGAGQSVSGAGDVNGDGFDEVMVGVPYLGGFGTGAGAAYIIYGKGSGFAANLALSGLTAAQGVRLDGAAGGDRAGASVSGAGDVNGDGFADVVVGALTAGSDDRGAAYVVFGGSALPATIALGGLGGATGFRAEGAAANDYAGGSVSAAGDVNGDGLADVLVGARGAGPGGFSNTSGAAYVILGNSLPFDPVFSLGPTGGTIAFDGVASDLAGSFVKGAGDVNGDGIDDLIVGAPQNGSAGGAGGAYVVFGRANLATTPPLLSALDGSNGFRLVGEETDARAGRAVSGAGDVNGDGFADLLVGAPNSDDGGTNRGQAYLVYGGPSGVFINPTIAANGKTATWTDVDGDLVTLKVNKGTLVNGNFQLLAANAMTTVARLLNLTLDGTFDGANVSITAKRAGGGDGRVNVGFLNAENVDLGAVTVGGDLGRIVAGDADDGIALKSLTVASLGNFGGRTGDTGTGLFSGITGPVGAVKIAGDVREARFDVVNAASAGTGKVASFTLGGNLIGGAQEQSGSITAEALGPVKIGGDIAGGAGANSGSVRSRAGDTTSVTVAGSLLGSAGRLSGTLGSAGAFGVVSVGGDVRGGSGEASGLISASTGIGAVKIGGSQLAGSGDASARISTAGGNIASVSIGGDARSSAAAFSGSILAGGSVGSVKIAGDVTGTVEQPYLIRGEGPLTGAKSVAIASVTVGGDFDHALVLGGYSFNNTPANGHAQIGAISVGGDWIASSVTAGLLTHADAESAAGIFGNGDDAFSADGPAGVVASIKSVTIKGAARGTFADGDRFAIVAEQIGSVTIGGVKVPLTKSTRGADPANDLAAIHVGATPDFVVREVSRTTAAPAAPDVTTPAAGSRSAFPAAFALGTLASGDGFKLSGIEAADIAGQAVSTAGDVNGDGFEDFIVSATQATEVPGFPGTAYVVFGRAGGLASFTLSALDGTNGFKVFGANHQDNAGVSVGAAGDINGDGFDDIIVGANGVDADNAANPSDDRGAAYVVFGRGSFAAVGAAGIALGSLDGTDGFKLVGAAAGNFAGYSASGAGDVNGDGFDDVIVGANHANGSNSGAAYIVFGKSRFVGAPTAGFTIGLGTLDGSNGLQLAGEGGGDQAGWSVSTAGDVNGDGFDDVVVGAPNGPGFSQSGSVYVVFGKTSFTNAPTPGFSIGLGSLQGTAGVKFTGANAFDRVGFSVSGASDVNGDGFDDLIVGASNFGHTGAPYTGLGAAYVIFGKSAFVPGPVADFSIGVGTLAAGDGFRLTGGAAADQAGYSVSGAGDVNGDGFADLLVGAHYADETATPPDAKRGAAYVVFGKSGGFGTELSLSALDGANGFKLSGGADGDEAGEAVSKAGDVNGDGFADVIVGADSGDGAVADSGAAYVIYGGPSGEFIDPTISPDGRTATWTDVDGDRVTLKVSKTTGTLDATNFKLLAKSTADARAQLLALNLGNEFEGADVSLTAKRAVGGDGKVNVGAINATFVDLGKVTVGGDLGKIVVGDGDLAAPVKSLTVGSFGVFGARTQDTGGNLTSQIFGPAGAIKILGDVREVTLLFQNAGSPGSADSVTVGGSLIGGKVNFSGLIAAMNGFGPVKIAGDLVGGAGVSSGYLEGPNINSLTIGGSMLGGAGLFSGTALAGSLVFTGVPSLTGSFGNVTIGGDQRGGDGLFSGSLASGLSMGKVSIGRDQIGGAGSASGLVFAQNPGADIASVTVGGDARGGDVAFSGGILAGGTLGPVTIKGDVVGTAEQAYLIRGGAALVGLKSVALTSLKVGGDFDHALILAGYGNNNAPVNGHAQIGAITIGGDWIASSVAAGLLPFAGATLPVNFFGNGDDTFINAGPVGVIASIASITIKGRAVGSLETGDCFGIVAESIGSVSIGGTKLGLTGNADTTPIFVGPTPDFAVREVTRV